MQCKFKEVLPARKFKFLMYFLIAMIFMLPNCYARIPESEFVLGYIEIMDDMNKVKIIYDEPVKSVSDKPASGYGSRWYHNYYDDDKNFYIKTSRYTIQ